MKNDLSFQVSWYIENDTTKRKELERNLLIKFRDENDRLPIMNVSLR